jgi:hypothetical protein
MRWSPALRAGTESRGSTPHPGQFYAENGPLRGPWNRLFGLMREGIEWVGEPLAFGQPLVEV